MAESKQPARVEFKDVSLLFKLYSDKGLSMKEAIVNRFKKRYREQAYKEFWVLNDINLTFQEGDRVGIIGRNGAGKSTLLKLVSRIYTPTKGVVDIQGSVAPLIELGAGFNAELTGRENIYLNGVILGFKPEEIKVLEQEIIEFADIGEFIDYPVKYYSSGMYMRLAFTVATAIKPDILIVDEIFAGGDVNFIDKATRRIETLFQESKIMLMVSHSMELVESMCNRCIVIDDSHVVFDGSVKEGIQRYRELNLG